MKITYSEEALKTLTLRELTRSGYRLSKEVTDRIYKNPLIGNLTSIAEWCGLYSAYVIGDENIYFLYGFDQSIIHKGRFVEAAGALWEESSLSACGFLSRDGFLFRNWNCATLPSSMQEFLRLQQDLKDLEMLNQRYLAAGFGKMPEAVAWDRAAYRRQFEKFIWTADNRCTVQNDAYAKTRYEEYRVLCDLAVWEWPMALTSCRLPGYIAWLKSRYCPGNVADTLALYQEPDSWMAAFEKNTGSCIGFSLPKDETDFVTEGLAGMRIPYLLHTEENSHKLSYVRNADRLVNGKFSSLTGKTFVSEDTALLFIHPSDLGALKYLDYKYTLSRFSAEENSFGDMLYAGTYSSQYRVNSDRCFASFLFFVPSWLLTDFKSFAKENDIRFGHPTAAAVNNESFSEGVTLIAEAFDMPLIEQYLFAKLDAEANTHQVSLNGDAPFERRSPAKMSGKKKDRSGVSQGTDGAFSRSVPWHYFGSAVSVTDAGTGKETKLPCTEMADGSWWYPAGLYDEKGLHVYNSKALQESSFQNDLAACAEYLKNRIEKGAI